MCLSTSLYLLFDGGIYFLIWGNELKAISFSFHVYDRDFFSICDFWSPL